MSPDRRAELRRQLLAAHRRHRARSRRRVPLIALSVLLLGTLFWVVSGIDDGDRAAAGVFVVDRTGGGLVIQVVGTVGDPGEAADELEEAGLRVEMVARPVPPWLVGAVVAARVPSTSAAVELSDLRVSQVAIPAGARAETVTIEYGREAGADEMYAYSGSPPPCRSWVGEPVDDELLARVAAVAGAVTRIQEAVESGVREISRAEVAAGATLVDVVPLSPSAVIVIVTDGAPGAPGASCGSA